MQFLFVSVIDLSRPGYPGFRAQVSYSHSVLTAAAVSRNQGLLLCMERLGLQRLQTKSVSRGPPLFSIQLVCCLLDS